MKQRSANPTMTAAGHKIGLWLILLMWCFTFGPNIGFVASNTITMSNLSFNFSDRGTSPYHNLSSVYSNEEILSSLKIISPLSSGSTNSNHISHSSRDIVRHTPHRMIRRMQSHSQTDSQFEKDAKTVINSSRYLKSTQNHYPHLTWLDSTEINKFQYELTERKRTKWPPIVNSAAPRETQFGNLPHKVSKFAIGKNHQIRLQRNHLGGHVEEERRSHLVKNGINTSSFLLATYLSKSLPNSNSSLRSTSTLISHSRKPKISKISDYKVIKSTQHKINLRSVAYTTSSSPPLRFGSPYIHHLRDKLTTLPSRIIPEGGEQHQLPLYPPLGTLGTYGSRWFPDTHKNNYRTRNKSSTGTPDVEILSLSVPPLPREGDTVTLTCHYQLRGQQLYSLSWWRGPDQFFVYNWSGDKSSYAFNGIRVDEARSTERSVVLVSVSASSGGEYKCEVMGEAPAFRTAVMYKNMTIIVPPSSVLIPRPPLGEGSLPPFHYRHRDAVALNCTATDARPRAALHWILNGGPVNPEDVTSFRDVTGRHERVTTSIGLRLTTLHNLHQDQVTVKCVASVLGHEVTSVSRTLHIVRDASAEPNTRVSAAGRMCMTSLVLPLTSLVLLLTSILLLQLQHVL